MLYEGGENAIDLEALQAQIDLSMALTDQMVSSWLPKSVSNKSNDLKAKSVDAELQDVLRRPPRLGVGAPLPEASSASQREAHQLKNKLVGKNKRRRFEDETENKDAEQASSEEEGRGKHAESNTKRIRLDPFSAGQGRGRMKKNEGVNGEAKELSNSAPSSSLPPKDPAKSSTPESATNTLSTLPDNVAENVPEGKPGGDTQHLSQSYHPDVDSSQVSNTSKKKRKKNKKKRLASNEPGSPTPTPTDANANVKPEGALPAVVHHEEGGSKLPSSTASEKVHVESSPDAMISTAINGEAAVDSPEEEAWHGFESSDDDLEEPSTQLNGTGPIAPSLLNGNGRSPSLDNTSSTTETPANQKKKKRKRKKKTNSTVPQTDPTSNAS